MQRVFSDWNSINRLVYDIAKKSDIAKSRRCKQNDESPRTMACIWHRYNDHSAKLSAREASRSSYGNLNFYRRQFSISVSRRRFTFVVALARPYGHYRMIRYTAGVSSIRQFLEIVLVSIEETELINGRIVKSNKQSTAVDLPAFDQTQALRPPGYIILYICPLTPTRKPRDSRGNKLIMSTRDLSELAPV